MSSGRYQTKVVKVDPVHPDAVTIAEAAELLRSGEVIALPTETVYGVGADGLNEAAVSRIFEAKGRPPDRPLVLLIAEPGDLDRVVEEITSEAEALVKVFWPGPLTIILRRSRSIPDAVTAGGESVGVRCPNSEIARALIKVAEVPLTVTSANVSGQEAPVDAAGVAKQLGGRIPLIIDGGRSPIGVASTVVDLTTRPAKLIREGTINKEELGRYIEIRD
ncbi:MAG: L-threonylcarbamoyladenylate synthase [Actinobacteria bacterium]|nr:L-threonylcarbamoyladenylate synthase [Actinomycetota bacterium]